MQYLHTDNPPRGEVCMWGPSIMKGYFRNPEKTAEALSEDGWIYTGDVGLVKKNGAIKIIDRAKNIFKLSQGEYIAPEKLENVYVQSKFVLQSWIYGDSLRDYLVGFFVLDP
jgi:long-chain acyl-CoA synthetase